MLKLVYNFFLFIIFLALVGSPDLLLKLEIYMTDLVLSNKLVVYDLQNQTIGWTEYNCEYLTALYLIRTEYIGYKLFIPQVVFAKII